MEIIKPVKAVNRARPVGSWDEHRAVAILGALALVAVCGVLLVTMIMR